jgi:hypothetical protein
MGMNREPTGLLPPFNYAIQQRSQHLDALCKLHNIRNIFGIVDDGNYDSIAGNPPFRDSGDELLQSLHVHPVVG